MANTGDTYICIKPFAAGEAPTDPSTDPEHWALFLPRGEKGEQGDTGDRGPQGAQGIQGETGDRGSKWYSYSYTPVSATIGGSTSYPMMPETEGAQNGDFFVSTHATSYGYFGAISANGPTLTFTTKGFLKGERGETGPQGEPFLLRLSSLNIQVPADNTTVNITDTGIYNYVGKIAILIFSTALDTKSFTSVVISVPPNGGTTYAPILLNTNQGYELKTLEMSLYAPPPLLTLRIPTEARPGLILQNIDILA